MKNCVLLPAVGKQNKTYSPNFTKPWNHLLELLCSSKQTDSLAADALLAEADGVLTRSCHLEVRCTTDDWNGREGGEEGGEMTEAASVLLRICDDGDDRRQRRGGGIGAPACR